MRSDVLIQYTSVTDGRTDRLTHSLTAARNRLWVVAPSMLTGHQQEPMGTDGQTELAWHIRVIAYMLSRVKTIR